MQTKRIICPKCKAVLEVKNSKNELEKQIACPSCRTALKVKFPPQQEPMEAKTYIAPPKQPADNGATQLAAGIGGATQLAADVPKQETTATLLFGGKTYPLEEGQNVVGRKANTSTATVQIETDDRYMSRQHCVVTVTTLPDGTKKVVLCNDQNKNATTIDGVPIEKGDQIRLTDGNGITMGRTTVIFKIQEK